jgi:hypothetical protein
MSSRKSDPKFVRAYERGLLRSAFVSLFWSVITERRKRDPSFTLQGLARKLNANKAEVSRWFRGDPNWTVNTIASLATALDLELHIEARERTTGIVFVPSGIKMLSPVQAIERPDSPTTSTGGIPIGPMEMSMKSQVTAPSRGTANNPDFPGMAALAA